MYSVTVCAILVIVGSVNSFALNRMRRDLQQSIAEIYGPPRSPSEARPLEHRMPASPHHALGRDPGLTPYIPRAVLEDLFGPPAGKKPFPGAEPPPPPHLYSSVGDDVTITREEKDSKKRDKAIAEEEAIIQRDIANIFGFPTTPLEALNATENSKINNTAVNLDDRFLSETLLKQQWTNNREKNEPDVKQPEETLTRTQLVPDPPRDRSGPLTPGKDRGLLEPTNFDHMHDHEGSVHMGSVHASHVPNITPLSSISTGHVPVTPVTVTHIPVGSTSTGSTPVGSTSGGTKSTSSATVGSDTKQDSNNSKHTLDSTSASSKNIVSHYLFLIVLYLSFGSLEFI